MSASSGRRRRAQKPESTDGRRQQQDAGRQRDRGRTGRSVADLGLELLGDRALEVFERRRREEEAVAPAHDVVLVESLDGGTAADRDAVHAVDSGIERCVPGICRRRGAAAAVARDVQNEPGPLEAVAGEQRRGEFDRRPGGRAAAERPVRGVDRIGEVIGGRRTVDLRPFDRLDLPGSTRPVDQIGGDSADSPNPFCP